MSSWEPHICIYHANCLDGFGAAWAIWKRWPNCEFRPGEYGKPLPIEGAEEKNVLLVDFSAPLDALNDLAWVANSVVVIDHHKTAEEALKPILCDVMMEDFESVLEWKRSKGEPVITAFFDMEQSGATMAWEFKSIHRSKTGHVVISDRVPELLLLIEDRDLWRFRYGQKSRAVAAALRSFPMDFHVWDSLLFKVAELVQEGTGIMRADQVNIDRILQDAYETEIDGFTVPVVNTPYVYASEAGNELLRRNPSAPFAATWFKDKNGNIRWSLRSVNAREDVSAIAVRHGGGGHRNAAGFVEVSP